MKVRATNVVNAAAWSFLQSWLARGITTTSFLLLGYLLNPRELGLYAVVAAWLAIAEMLADQSVAQAIVQIEEADDSRLNAAFVVGGGMGLLISVSTAVAAVPMSRIFREPQLIELLQMAAVCPVLIGLCGVPSGLLRRSVNFKALTRRTIFASGISSIAGLGLAFGGFGAVALVVQATLFHLVSLVVLWRFEDWRPSARPHHRAILVMARLATGNAGIRLADFAETRGIELFIGRMAGVHELGIYAFASKLAQTGFQLVAVPLLDLSMSLMARSKNSVQMSQSLDSGTLVMTMIALPPLIGLSLAAEPLLRLIYDSRWIGAALPLSLLCAAYAVRALLYVSGTALVAKAFVAESLAVASFRAIFAVMISGLLVAMNFGNAGAAAGYLLASLAAFAPSVYFTMDRLGASGSVVVGSALRVVAAAIVAGALFACWQQYMRELDGSIAVDLVAATILTTVLLGMFVLLSANRLQRGLRRLPRSGVGLYLLRWINPLVDTVVALRLRWQLLWFRATLGIGLLHGCVHGASTRGLSLVVPADTVEIDGSLGDQAMLLGLGQLVPLNRTAIVTSKRSWIGGVFGENLRLPFWDDVLAGWHLGRRAHRFQALYIIGGDVLDGYYSMLVSCKRIALANAFTRVGIPTTLLGFSFNPQPHPLVVACFRELNDSIRICVRDEISLQRFERLTGRSAELVADLAFLMSSSSNSMVERTVREWAIHQRMKGRRVIGINLNPQVVACLEPGAEETLASSAAKCCESLHALGVSVVLVPHDFRPGCADLGLMSAIASKIDSDLPDSTLVLTQGFSAPEIKAACGILDLVLSARMHLAIAALSIGVPACGIQYQGKFEGLFLHFGFGSDSIIAPEDALDAEQLSVFVMNRLAAANADRRQIQNHIDRVVLLARRNVPEAAGSLASKPGEEARVAQSPC